MKRIELTFLLTLLGLTLLDAPAHAACDTSGTDTAYGDFWLERDSSCQCIVKQATFACVKSGNSRERVSVGHHRDHRRWRRLHDGVRRHGRLRCGDPDRHRQLGSFRG